MADVPTQCRICSFNGKLEPHHIISQHRAKKIKQRDLISNEGNIVWLCNKCHKQTTASLVRYKMIRNKQDKETMRDVFEIKEDELNALIDKLNLENKILKDELRERDSAVSMPITEQIVRGVEKSVKHVQKEVKKEVKSVEKNLRKTAKQIENKFRKFL